MDGTTETKSYYYRAWPLIVFSILSYFITSTVASSMNVAAGILEAERGWDSVLVTSMISVASTGNVVMGFIAGRACSKHSAKALCFLWGILYVVGVLLMGFSRAFAMFSISMVVANAAASAWGYNTTPVLLANWFPTKKGTVQGFVSMGIPLGAGFASMVYNFGYQRFGVDGAFWPFLVVAAAALMLLACGISDTPEERGLEPDTMRHCEPHKPDYVQAEATKAPDAALAKRLLRNPKFIVVSLILGIQLIYSGGLMVQLAPRLFELGYTMDQAIADMMISAVFACIGSFICGVIGDKLGSRVGAILTFVIGIVAILLNLLGNPACVFASLALIGMVTGGADNWPVNICAEYFGREGFSDAFGVMFPIIQLVGAIGPSFFALISGATGSYFVSYIAGAVLMLAGLLAFVLVTRNGMVGEGEQTKQ